jgi:AcrR family transcriptional regulator
MATGSTPQRIVGAARRLLERDGRDAVTMRRVAGVVGITAMAIYHHYPDRAALLDAVADQGFEELAARYARGRLPAGFEPCLFKMTDIYVAHALAHPRLFELMFLAPRPGARRFPQDFRAGRSPTASPLAAAIEAGMASRELRDDDPWEIAFELGALLEGFLLLYLGGRIDATAARFRALIRRSLRRHLHGIRR